MHLRLLHLLWYLLGAKQYWFQLLQRKLEPWTIFLRAAFSLHGFRFFRYRKRMASCLWLFWLWFRLLGWNTWVFRFLESRDFVINLYIYLVLFFICLVLFSHTFNNSQSFLFPLLQSFALLLPIILAALWSIAGRTLDIVRSSLLPSILWVINLFIIVGWSDTTLLNRHLTWCIFVKVKGSLRQLRFLICHLFFLTSGRTEVMIRLWLIWS